MEEKLLVTSSPHIRSNDTTRSIMLSVLIALAPASIYSVVIFGFRAMMIIIIGTLSSVGAEALYNVMIKHKQTVSDLSAAVSGLLLSAHAAADRAPVAAGHRRPVRHDYRQGTVRRSRPEFYEPGPCRALLPVYLLAAAHGGLAQAL